MFLLLVAVIFVAEIIIDTKFLLKIQSLKTRKFLIEGKKFALAL
jgi:hypothetical protein